MLSLNPTVKVTARLPAGAAGGRGNRRGSGGISGSGPTLFALCDKPDTASALPTGWVRTTCKIRKVLFILPAGYGGRTSTGKLNETLQFKDHNEQVSFAQAVTQGLGKIRGCFSRTTCRNSA